jgi:hypothetical protein
VNTAYQRQGHGGDRAVISRHSCVHNWYLAMLDTFTEGPQQLRTMLKCLAGFSSATPQCKASWQTDLEESEKLLLKLSVPIHELVCCKAPVKCLYAPFCL